MCQPGQGLLQVLLGIVVCAAWLVPSSTAQNYPAKPIRLIVGYPPGGGTDATARVIGQKLTESLGQNIVVENRPGATGAIAAERVATSPPDGYTLLMNSANDTVLPALRSKLPFDVERDFAPVSLVVIAPMVLTVHPSVPARNVKELIALAQARPGKLSFGSAGTGNTTHLTGELFNLMAKVRTTHVPYKGSGDSIMATASGQIEMNFASITAALPMLENRRLRALAVTSAQRASLIPSVPTLDESGLRGFNYSSWFGVAAPAGTPKNIVEHLSAEIGKAANTSEIRGTFSKQGLEVQTNTPEQYAKMIHRDVLQNAKLVKQAGIRPE